MSKWKPGSLVERLRQGIERYEEGDAERAMDAAADEIERLTRERCHLEHQLSLGEQLNDRLTRERDDALALLIRERGEAFAVIEKLRSERDEALEQQAEWVNSIDDGYKPIPIGEQSTKSADDGLCPTCGTILP